MNRKTFSIRTLISTSLTRAVTLLLALGCLPCAGHAADGPSPSGSVPAVTNGRPAKSETPRAAAFDDNQQGRLALLRDWLRKRSAERHGGRVSQAAPRVAAYRLSPPPLPQKERRVKTVARWKRRDPVEAVVSETAKGFERGPDGRVRHRYQFGADPSGGLEAAMTEPAGEAAPTIHIGGKHYYRVAGEIKLGTYGSAESLSGDRSRTESDQSAGLASDESSQSQTATRGQGEADP